MSQSHLIVVSVIIPVYNDSTRLKLCLEALENQTFPSESYEVIVVDNRSSEPVEPVVAAFAHAHYAFEEQQSSYAARNRGLQVARSSVLAFTDSDCLPNPDWIEQGVNLLRSVEGVGLIGGRVDLFTQKPNAPNWVEAYEIAVIFRQKNYVEQRNFAVTANVFTTRAVIDAVGVFDGTRISGGDYEWGRRVAAAGYRLVYGDTVVVRHPARSTFAELRKRSQRLTESAYNTRRHHKRKRWMLFLRLVRGYLPPITLLRLFFRPELPDLRQRTKAFLVSIYVHYYRGWYFSQLVMRDRRNVTTQPEPPA